MKIVVMFLLLGICFLPMNTFGDCISGDCENGQGTLIYPDGSKYEGQWKDGRRDGQGALSFPDGGSFIGQWKGGLFNGQGTMIYRYGRYEGQWKDGMKNGQGVMTYLDGGKYEGEWKDDKISGQGTYTYPDGGIYVGQWKDGRKDGQGTYTASDKHKYSGQFKDGKTDGQGIMIYPDGAKYEGEWKDSRKNGQGTYTYPDGSKYEGEWKDSRKNGQGTYTYPDGAKYTGRFEDGKPIGQGSLTYPDGSKYEGQLKSGKFIKNLESDKEVKPGLEKTAEVHAAGPAVKVETIGSPQMSKGKETPSEPDAYPYTIQVSSYPDKEKSDNLAMALRKKDFPAFTCPTQIPGKGEYHRVFVGFYRTLEETRNAASKLRGQKDVNPLETKMPYAVQVGSFASDQDLKTLEAELQSKAYLSYSIPDVSDNKKTRLLIGAFRTAAEASVLSKKLKKEGLDAKVVKR